MKKDTLIFLLALVILMLTLLHGAEAQKIYMVKIKQNTGKVIKGELLYAAGDSIGVFQKGSGSLRLKVTEILTINIHRKNGAGRGALIGAGTGAAIGALIGLASYARPHCSSGSFCFDFGPGANAAGGAILGAAVGTIIGAVGGANGKEIKIDNSPSKFDVFKNQYGLLSPVQKVNATSN